MPVFGPAFTNLVGAAASKTQEGDKYVPESVKGGINDAGLGYESSSGPQVSPLPETPTIEGATDKAKIEAARKRRITLLSGGKTDYTGGQTYGGSSSAPKSLLGA